MILPQQFAAAESTARAYTSVDVDAGAATPPPVNLLANIQLTPQQLSFLSAWRKGKYPVQVEQDFIISVRNLVFNNKS